MKFLCQRSRTKSMALSHFFRPGQKKASKICKMLLLRRMHSGSLHLSVEVPRYVHGKICMLDPTKPDFWNSPRLQPFGNVLDIPILIARLWKNRCKTSAAHSEVIGMAVTNASEMID